MLLIAAAGNNGCDRVHVPAALLFALALALALALTVGALGRTGEPMYFANYGGSYAMNGLMVPGEDIRSQRPAMWWVLGVVVGIPRAAHHLETPASRTAMMKASHAAGSASASRATTRSDSPPESSRLTGTSTFLPEIVRGILGT